MHFNCFFQFTSILCVCISITGCKWRDDFRDRIQPQYQEQKSKPTFNEDSKDYVGDETAKGQIPEHKKPKLEEIDALSDIPELPDKPEPML